MNSFRDLINPELPGAWAIRPSRSTQIIRVGMCLSRQGAAIAGRLDRGRLWSSWQRRGVQQREPTTPGAADGAATANRSKYRSPRSATRHADRVLPR